MRCVIVEDEIPAVEELKYMLEQYDWIEIKGAAYDSEEGYRLIREVNPDVVFMDINMPGYSGMELAKKVKEYNENIEIVFVTAYEEHAVKAFEVEAVDYLLKPFDEKRMDITMKRLRENLNYKKSSDMDLSISLKEIIGRLDREKKNLRKIACEVNGKIVLIDCDEIFYCYIEDEKTYIKTREKSYLTNYTLAEIEERTEFFRSHRSYLVNIENIKELHPWFHGTYKLIMNDKEKSEIPLSRNNVKKLKDILGL
jgi:two-component system response regulator LytT